MEDWGHPSDPCAQVGLQAAILHGHTITLQFIFVSLGKTTSDLLGTNACYASEFGRATWTAAVQMIDISALAEYADRIGLEIRFVDVHDYPQTLRYGLMGMARSYAIASQMGMLFLRTPTPAALPYRTLLPSAETLAWHSDARRNTGGRPPLRPVIYLFHFETADLPLELQQLYEAPQREARKVLKMHIMRYFRFIFNKVANGVATSLGMFVRHHGLQ